MCQDVQDGRRERGQQTDDAVADQSLPEHLRFQEQKERMMFYHPFFYIDSDNVD